MARSTAATVDDYLAAMPEDRRVSIGAVRELIRANLADGFVETINWGMIAYEVSLAVEPDTYNKQPLMYAALANQKRHMALYLSAVTPDSVDERGFRERYVASGKRLDMGKSCVRFRILDDLPLDVIGEEIARHTPASFAAWFRSTRK